MRLRSTLSFAFALASCTTNKTPSREPGAEKTNPPSAPATEIQAGGGPDLMVNSQPVTQRGRGGSLANRRRARSAAIGITYGGGPVMLGTPNIYLIWYGAWSGNT